MVKAKGKAKRLSLATSHEEGPGCRRSARITYDGSGEKAEVLHTQIVYGLPVLPPASGRPSRKTRLGELNLTSIRVYQETILSINSLLSPRECNAWIQYGEEKGFEHSFHTRTSELAHRDNGRISIHSPEVAAAIFSRVLPFVPADMDGRTAAGCNANMRIYRYTVGQRFGKHVDESVEDENGHTSQWTVLIYLNGRSRGGSTTTEEVETGKTGDTREDALRGGETVFYKGNYGGKIAASFSPLQGACLVHGHGQRCLLHEGAAVTAGVKYLLRTDVMYACP